MTKEKLYYATVEIGNYTVSALGRTEEEAKRAVLKTVNRQFERTTLKRLEDWNGLWVMETTFGEGWTM